MIRDASLATALVRVLDGLERERRTAREADDFLSLVRQLRDVACSSEWTKRDPYRREIRAVRALITEKPLRGVRLANRENTF